MNEELKPKRRHKGTIPQKEADIILIGNTISESWAKHDSMTLSWTSAADLKTSVTTLETSYGMRSDVKGARAGITQEFKNINVEIDSGVVQIKSYIGELFSTKDAPAYFSHFGIERHNEKYTFPIDKNKRQLALEQMRRGIDQHGLANRKYGKAFWDDIYSRYVSIHKKAIACDSASTEHVNIKTVQKAYIRRVLNSLVHLIIANNPDTWKEELRIWGFQKEKY
ncbi:MAG: hypothetical protein LBV41_00205 [Cytophagaceae bacterium]|jgi:phosphoribosyl-AMP cyclohydrolase|nr:hypothetical protein [Cytophagaceae bacterium]